MITTKGQLVKFIVSLIVLIMSGFFVLDLIVGPIAPLIQYNGDGSKMTVYANTVTASDGMKYRVTISTHYEPGKQAVRIVDMYSPESKYASIGTMRSDFRSWNELYVCSGDQVRTSVSCPRNDFEAEKLLNEAVKKTMIPENTIGNMEILWSWEVGTKEVINQIKNK